MLNWGVKSDISTVRGHHNLKIGLDLKQTRLLEEFGFGITDFGFNPVCLDNNGDPAGAPTITDPTRCARFGLTANPDLQPGLVPFDLTRGGKPRHVFNLGLGTDNLFHSEGPKRWVVSLEIANLTNKVALYNFLSTFSDTHFLQPRTVVAHVGFVF